MDLSFDDYTQEELDRNLEAAFSKDKSLAVAFAMKPLLQEFRSAQEGRPIYEDVPFIRIHIPGDKNTVLERAVTDMDKRRFEDKWLRFLKAHETDAPEVGTPLSVMPWVSPAQVAELKYFNITSVEDLAELSDVHLGKLMGGNKLRDRAKQFLSAAEANKQQTALEKHNEQLQAQMASMQDQINKLLAAQNTPAKPAPAKA